MSTSDEKLLRLQEIAGGINYNNPSGPQLIFIAGNQKRARVTVSKTHRKYCVSWPFPAESGHEFYSKEPSEIASFLASLREAWAGLVPPSMDEVLRHKEEKRKHDMGIDPLER